MTMLAMNTWSIAEIDRLKDAINRDLARDVVYGIFEGKDPGEVRTKARNLIRQGSARYRREWMG